MISFDIMFLFKNAKKQIVLEKPLSREDKAAEILAREAVGHWAARQRPDLLWPSASFCGIGAALDYTVPLREDEREECFLVESFVIWYCCFFFRVFRLRFSLGFCFLSLFSHIVSLRSSQVRAIKRLFLEVNRGFVVALLIGALDWKR